jgi:hypothetical protein
LTLRIGVFATKSAHEGSTVLSMAILIIVLLVLWPPRRPPS